MFTIAASGFSTVLGMHSDDVKTFAAGLQAGAAVIALVYIAIQLRRQTDSFRGQDRAAQAIVYHGFTDIMVSIDRCFFEHPELRPFFYSGAVADDEDPIHIQLVALAEMLRDLEDHLDRQQDMLQDSYEGWSKYFKYLRENSPTYAQHCAETRDWYKNAEKGAPVLPTPPRVDDAPTEGGASPRPGREEEPPAASPR